MVIATEYPPYYMSSLKTIEQDLFDRSVSYLSPLKSLRFLQ